MRWKFSSLTTFLWLPYFDHKSDAVWTSERPFFILIGCKHLQLNRGWSEVFPNLFPCHHSPPAYEGNLGRKIESKDSFVVTVFVSNRWHWIRLHSIPFHLLICSSIASCDRRRRSLQCFLEGILFQSILLTAAEGEGRELPPLSIEASYMRL